MSPDAWETAQQLSDGEVSSEGLVAAALQRIEHVDPIVNAFTVVHTHEALAAARDSDARRASGSSRGRLDGIPISIKDHIWLAAAPATNGSVALRDFVPPEDALSVSRLKAAGAVIIGKTNNPEFCYRGFTDNDLWGLTRNPWSLDRTPGGSSGGAGASVAYGATPIALGTDGGGSIRIPAAFCGVVGHKPTFGLVPTEPGFRGWPSLSVHGPLTRTVRDAALALSVLAGRAAGDVTAAVSRPVDWSTLRVAVSEDLGWAAVEQSVRSAFRRAVEALVGDGARVVEAAPDTPYPVSLWNDIALAEGFASEGPLLDEWSDRLTPGTREIIEAGRSITAQQYLDAQEQRRQLTRTWADFFAEYDVLLAPSMPIPAFSVDIASPDVIDGHPVDPFFDDWCVLALPANLTGQPSCAMPIGFADGLPVGMQVIGPPGADALVLAIAATYERLAPWSSARPAAVAPRT